MKKRKLLYLFPVAALLLSGCDFSAEKLMFWKKNAEEEQQTQQEGGEQGGQQGGEQQGGEQQVDKTFTGLSLDDTSVAYDGQPHTLALQGELPDGASVSYGEAGNTFTAVGEHEVTATITCTGYTTLVLHATLTITKGSLEGVIVFENATVPYDGQPHSIAPVIPAQYADAEVNYGAGGNTFTDPGAHEVTATISLANYNDLVLSATLTITVPQATESLMIENFEGLSSNDLASDFTLEYYNNGWVTPQTASLSIANNELIGSGSQTMKLNLSHQGNRFKVTKSISPLDKKYNGIAFDTLVENYAEGAKTEFLVQLWVDNLPLPDLLAGYRRSYVTWTVTSDAPSNWTHWEIPFDDPSISINSGAITLDQLSQFGLTLQDLCVYVTDVAILVGPNAISNGPKSYAFVDNIEFITRSSRVEQQVVNFANRSWTIASNDGTAFKLDLDGTNGATFQSLNLENNLVLEGTYTTSGNKLSLDVSPDSGTNHLFFELEATSNGAVLDYCDAPTGDLAVLAPFAAHTNFDDKSFSEYIVVDNFESYDSVGQGFDSTNDDLSKPLTGLRGAYYGDMYSGSSNTPGPIDSGWNLVNGAQGYWNDYLELETGVNGGHSAQFRNHSTNQVRYMSIGLVNGSAISLGKGSIFSFFVKGTAAQTMKMRVYYVNQITSSNQQATSGYCGYMENIPVTTEWTQVKMPIDPSRHVFGFMFTPTKANARVLLDDIEIYGEADPRATYVAPTPVETYALVDGEYYLWNGSNDAFRLTISDSVSQASMIKCGSPSATPFTVTRLGDSLTFKDSVANGAGLTITADLTADNTMKITAVSGQMASQMSGSLLNKPVKHCANVNLDFSDGAGSGAYSNTHWTGQEYSNNTWNDVAPDMNSRKDANNNLVVNLVAGGNTRNFIYTPDLPMGPVNHVEFDMANYYSGSAGNITIKVCVIDSGGTKYYALGDADNMFTVAKDTSKGSVLNHYDLPINFCAGAKIQITAKASAGSSYLYIDNFKVNYSTTISKVDYKLTDTSNWDISENAPEFYAWVWGGSDPGHWEKLTLKTDNGKYFDLKLFNTYEYVKIVRVDPAATTKPKKGSYSYGTYNNNEIWNETSDIALNGTGGTVNFSL